MNNILVSHFTSDYCTQKLYPELFKSLDKYEIEQNVYTCARRPEQVGQHALPEFSRIKIHYSSAFKLIHKIFFRTRIETISNDYVASDIYSVPRLNHAHSLFSDGAIALSQKLKYGIPFIIAIRNGDINYYFKFRPDLFNIGCKILNEASAVIFITPGYKSKLFKYLPEPLATEVNAKSHVIPNGISPVWLKTPTYNQRPDRRILTVNDFTANKNNIRLAKAFLKVKDEIKCQITFLGGGGSDEHRIREMVKAHPTCFHYHDRVSNPDNLITIFQQHSFFAMPSFHETFGLVYAEALSQGLPILCSKGEGISSYFADESFCFTVNPNSIDDIADKLVELCRFTQPEVWPPEVVQHFDWGPISKRYFDLYQSILNPGARVG